jgi:hypothetical protein
VGRYQFRICLVAPRCDLDEIGNRISTRIGCLRSTKYRRRDLLMQLPGLRRPKTVRRLASPLHAPASPHDMRRMLVLPFDLARIWSCNLL